MAAAGLSLVGAEHLYLDSHSSNACAPPASDFPLCPHMDPLSVTASIVGILAAAGKVGELLHGAISTAKDAPRVLISLACEVQEVRAAVFSLKLLLADLSSTQTHRAALIQIDQLIVTLADTVLTFSELETAITPFVASQGAIVSLRAKFKWLWTEDSCNKIVDRLQRHKSTLSLMLNILQW